MKRQKLIIARPQQQKPLPRFGWTLLTLVFWGIYVYLWMPLISLALWVVGFGFFYEQMIENQGYRSLAELLGFYSLVILIIGTIFLLWARINLWRFRNVERRREPPRIGREQQAHYYGLDAGRLAHWQYQSRLMVSFDQEGRITEVSNQNPSRKTASDQQGRQSTT